MAIKYILAAIEIFFLFTFIAAYPVLNAGNAAGIAVCFMLLVITVFFSKFKTIIGSISKHTAGKIILIAFSALIVAGMAYAVFLSVKMYKALTNEPEKPKVIVVLGCKVKGTKPTRMLRRRLDTACKALQEHEDVMCVVSGGQGPGEKISEAQAMRDYLVEQGIDESRIIMEDKSTSTYENLKFTFEKTDAIGLGRDITIVTDGYHQYRASLIAKSVGAGEVTAYSASTEARFIPTYWVREWLGLTHFFILGD